MSIQEDQELRERLDTLLSGIEPRPAPVALAMRQGKGIRMRRWGAAAVGVVFVAAGAVALPTALHTPRSSTAVNAALRYSVTVHSPGKNARGGLIAYGTENGNRWRVAISGSGADESMGGNTTSIDLGSVSVTSADPVDVLSAGSLGGGVTIVGAVASDVTAVAITLPGDRVLTLKPVRYSRQWFVAVVIPTGVPIVRAVAYDRARELAYSVPYERISLVSWWRPGQSGPARFTATIASGIAGGHAWRYVTQFGPWGYCYATPGGTDCFAGTTPTGMSAPRDTVAMMACGALGNGNPGNPTSVLASAPADVRQVALHLSGGSTVRVRAVDVAGVRMIGYILPVGQRVLRASMYGAAGRMLGSTSAADLSCAA